jgi:hypothetical protein
MLHHLHHWIFPTTVGAHQISSRHGWKSAVFLVSSVGLPLCSACYFNGSCLLLKLPDKVVGIGW